MCISSLRWLLATFPAAGLPHPVAGFLFEGADEVAMRARSYVVNGGR